MYRALSPTAIGEVIVPPGSLDQSSEPDSASRQTMRPSANGMYTRLESREGGSATPTSVRYCHERFRGCANIDFDVGRLVVASESVW